MSYLAMREEGMSDKVEDTLEDRGSDYGPWPLHAEIDEAFDKVIQKYASPDMPPYAKRSMCHQCNKMARSLACNWRKVDNWLDIEGYARLVRRELEK